MDRKTVKERFSLFGGVARFVLQVDPTSHTENVQLLETAIHGFRLEHLRVVKSVVDLGTASHKVVHQQVDDDYMSCKLTFASLDVQRRVFEAIEENEKPKLIGFITTSHIAPLLSTLRGSFFEKVAHSLQRVEASVSVSYLVGMIMNLKM